MLDELLKQFMNSNEGTQARESLQRNFGLSGTAAHESLGATAEAAGAHVPQVSDEPALRDGLLGALAGLVMGGGASGAMQGAMGGALSGRAGEMISRRTGIDPRTASMVAAAAVPFLIRFLQQRGRHANANVAPSPAAPQPMPVPSQASGPVVNNPFVPPAKSPMQPGAKTEARPGGQRPGASTSPWKRLV